MSSFGDKLLKLARDSLITYFSNTIPDSDFSEKRGVFVTLHKDGQLRGCIGYPDPVMELSLAVIDAARHAAFNDPRFEPVKEDELTELKIEVSVLSVPKVLEVAPEEYVNNIKIGRDGLIIRGAFGSGLLLPQVATEEKWNATEFLNHLCLKAGMSQDDWKDPVNQILTFQAEIFSEG